MLGLLETLKQLYFSLDLKDRFGLVKIVLLSFIVSIAEIFSIGLIVPFLALLVSPEAAASSSFMKFIFEGIGIDSAGEMLAPVTFLFIFAALLSGLVRVYYVHVQTRFTYGLLASLNSKIFALLLDRPYQYFVARSSSEILSTVTAKTQHVVNSVVSPSVRIVGSTIILLSVGAFLLSLNPMVGLSAISLILLIYLVILVLVKARLRKKSLELVSLESVRLKIFLDSLNSMRDIIIDEMEDHFATNQRDIETKYHRKRASVTIWSLSPRFVIEALALSIFAVLAYFLSDSTNFGTESAIPTLGALAFGAQKLLPIIQQVYQAFVEILGNQDALHHVMPYLDRTITREKVNKNMNEMPLAFQREIRFSNVALSYSKEGMPVIQNASFTIPKGAKVAIVGKSGSGKSTLIDMLIGLINPTSGSILIDDQPLTGQNLHLWFKKLAYVPQSVYIMDGPLEENIKYSRKFHDESGRKLLEVTRAACLEELVAASPNGLSQLLQDFGKDLSGGERQRIAIARALYKPSEVIILDEGTSALDRITAKEVIQNIIECSGEDGTVIFVTHRLEAVEEFDLIFEVKDGLVSLHSRRQH